MSYCSEIYHVLSAKQLKDYNLIALHIDNYQLVDLYCFEIGNRSALFAESIN